MIKIADIISLLESKAPSGSAESWDNTGLLVGDPQWETEGVVATVDLTPEAIQAAKKAGYRLILNHHPCIFPKSQGLGSIVADGSGTSNLVFDAIREGIAVAAYHTNFDQCALEVVETVSKGLGVAPLGRLLDKPKGSLLKLVVFVPETHLQEVQEALFEAGAGHIGNYDQCSFSGRGEGSFRGGATTEPFLGTPGVQEKAKEIRLETVLPRGLTKPILAALRQSHPYEEIAYDLYALEQGPSQGGGLVSGLGYGFWGDFPEPKAFPDLARDVKALFRVSGFWCTDPVPKKQVQRIGYVAGKGSSFLSAAVFAGCDVFITGEAGYHTVLEGKRRGVAVIELGHRESECFFAPTVSEWLKELGLKTLELECTNQRIHA